MKILWLDINSSYSHSSVALPAIHAQVRERKDWEWCVVRGTIHDDPGALAAEVAEHRPDVIAATFWLFTHTQQIEILSRTVQLLENTMIICGGPEFLGDNEVFLRRHPFVTAVLRGEGEEALPKLLNLLSAKWENVGSAKWENVGPEQQGGVEGLCWISSQDQIYHDNGMAKAEDFAALHYPEESEFFRWDKPFVQLETTRGCFNTCAFCVSGGEKPVRVQSIEQVRSRLENICAHGIQDIRVLDRTFNYDIRRACQLLDLFAQYQGKMRFHLEIHPSLLSEELQSKLAALPADLLHLEAGIQSLNHQVLEESGRKGSLESSLNGLKYLCSLNHIQTHADLIVGLPFYRMDMLCADIVQLIRLGVNELQVESLKVLPGTRMQKEASAKGLKYAPLPPYEILQTPDMTTSELKRAMQISRMLDFYYNAPCWQKITRNLICEKPEFLSNFTSHLRDIMVLDSPLSLERRGLILYDYIQKHHPDFLTACSIAWIQAGFSLKKAPAGTIQKVKQIEAFLAEHPEGLSVEYGEAAPTHRYYLFTPTSTIEPAERPTAPLAYLFAYDANCQQSTPTFWAQISD